MNKNETKLREHFKYLFEDNSVLCSEIKSKTVAELAETYISGWVDEGIAPQMLRYGKEHPNAGMIDLLDFEETITPPLEIAEDDELTEAAHNA